MDYNNKQQPLCDYSDLPIIMCAHCQASTTPPKIQTVTTTQQLEQTAGHRIPEIRATTKSEPLTCPHPKPSTQPLCDACLRAKSSIYTGTKNHPLQQLAEIPDLAADVEATRNHKNPTSHENPKHTPPSPAIPADLETLDCLRTDSKGLLHKLQTAIQDVNENLTPADTWQDVCNQLRALNPQWDNKPNIRHTIHKVHTQLRLAARIPAPLKLACPRCQNPIRLQPGGQYYLCDAGHEINHWAEIDRMARLVLYATPITLAQAAIEYSTPLRTLQRLMKNVPPSGKNGNARTWHREKIEAKLTKNHANQAA